MNFYLGMPPVASVAPIVPMNTAPVPTTAFTMAQPVHMQMQPMATGIVQPLPTAGVVPQVAGMTAMPGVVPQVAGMTAVPGVIPQVPGMTAVPGVVSQIPGMATVPGVVPTVTGMTTVPGVVPVVAGKNSTTHSNQTKIFKVLLLLIMMFII